MSPALSARHWEPDGAGGRIKVVMRPTRVIGAPALAGVLVAPPVAAKDGVRAKLDEPVRLGTPPGETMRVAWRLVDDEDQPFGAGGIYLRVSRCGQSLLRVRATAHGQGRYSVRLTAPKNGIRRLAVGLQGWRIIGDRRERADMIFAFDPPLSRRCS